MSNYRFYMLTPVMSATFDISMIIFLTTLNEEFIKIIK